jgi:hypothetical protein
VNAPGILEMIFAEQKRPSGDKGCRETCADLASSLHEQRHLAAVAEFGTCCTSEADEARRSKAGSKARLGKAKQGKSKQSSEQSKSRSIPFMFMKKS